VKPLPEPHLQKIAVLRANTLGDLIFKLPALEALRAAYAPALSINDSGPRHRPAISWRLTSPQCGRNIINQPCPHAVSFIAAISTAEIVASALELYQP